MQNASLGMEGGSNRFFPDGDGAFHFVDEPLAGGKGFAAVRGDDFNPERRFVDFDKSSAMDDANGFDRPALFDLIEEEIELVFGHFLEGFVFERLNGSAGFAIADDAEKINCGTHAVRH